MRESRQVPSPAPASAIVRVLLALAAVSTLAAVVLSVRAAKRLPQVQQALIDPRRLEDALAREIRGLGPQGAEALALLRASARLNQSLRTRAGVESLERDVANCLPPSAQAAAGRLAQAAARLRALETQSVPVAQWWPGVSPYLSGCETRPLPHHLPRVVQAAEVGLRRSGCGPGTAATRAWAYVGNDHGPFVQYLSERLRRVMKTQADAGDAAGAAQCRRLLAHWLAQWTLDDGPAGLRLLAADELSRTLTLTAGADTSTRDRDDKIVAGLQAWRAAYRSTARARGGSVLSAVEGVNLAPVEHDALLRRIVLLVWCGVGMAVAALPSLALGWRGVLPPEAAARQRLAIGATVCVAVVLAAGAAWPSLFPASSRSDVRAELSQLRHLPRHPFAAAALTILGLTACGWLAAGSAQRRGENSSKGPALRWQFGALATFVWLALAIATIAAALSAARAAGAFESALAKAAQAPIIAVAGPESDRLLDPLRQAGF